MSDRTALLARIRAIAARTTDNGCTEAEAMSAATILAKLLAEHGMSMSDAEIGEELCKTEYLDTGRKAAHEVRFSVVAIADLCDCKCWGEQRNGTRNIVYFGLPGDVESAVYLTSVIRASMDAELLGYMRRSAELGSKVSRHDGHSFLMGMATRVSSRLGQMKGSERQHVASTTGRDLVAVKTSVVSKQFAALGMKLGGSRRSSYSPNRNAFGAGQAAGDRVGLHRGIGSGNTGPLLIGR